MVVKGNGNTEKQEIITKLTSPRYVDWSVDYCEISYL